MEKEKINKEHKTKCIRDYDTTNFSFFADWNVGQRGRMQDEKKDW